MTGRVRDGDDGGVVACQPAAVEIQSVCDVLDDGGGVQVVAVGQGGRIVPPVRTGA